MKSVLTRLIAGLLLGAMLVSCTAGAADTVRTPRSPRARKLRSSCLSPIETTEEPATTTEPYETTANPVAVTPSSGDDIVYYPIPDLYAEGSKEIDDTFVSAAAKLGFTLLNAGSGKESRMVSPVSVLYALGLAANGAAGDTRTQMENALFAGVKTTEFNQYFRYFSQNQPQSEKIKLNVANSAWINTLSDFTPDPWFLINAANFFSADVYGVNYAAPGSAGRINAWTSEKTDGMIQKIVDELAPKSPLMLINAVLFDGKWKQTYADKDVRDRAFTSYDGSEAEREFLSSKESVYFRLGKGIGFERPYDEKYSFVGILPDAGTDVFDYAATIDGEAFVKALKNETRLNDRVFVDMPSFTFDYSAELSETLAGLGMPLAFSDDADFSAMGAGAEDFFISSVLHKTRIELTREGTRAAAVTAITFGTTAIRQDQPVYITLDRPFVFAIVDSETKLPVFCGIYCGD